MAFVLKSPVVVDPDPGRGMGHGEQLTLEAGTALADIPKHERDQLAPDHFADESDPGKVPKDWRPQERQDSDAEYRARLKAETGKE